LREWLMTDGHLQPRSTTRSPTTRPSHRQVAYTIETGPHYDKVLVAFEGVSGIDPDDLIKIINQQKLERQLFTDPLVVTELLQRYYRDQGYLAAEIDEPHIEFQGATARVVMPVREGDKFTARHVTTRGNKVWGTEALLQQLPVMEGEPFLPVAAENALDKIRTLYWPLGYNDVRSDYSLVLDRGAGVVDITFTIKEGPQSVVGPIQVRGTQRLTENLVRNQIELQPGEPLDLSALAKSRRNLYDIGAFSTVQINQGDRGRREENRQASAAGRHCRRSTEQRPTHSGRTVGSAGTIGGPIPGAQRSKARSDQRHRSRGAATADPLRRVVRHRARHWRHLRYLAAQLPRRRTRDWTAVALRQAVA
jgi:outer membrane protein assembly factor BamA